MLSAASLVRSPRLAVIRVQLCSDLQTGMLKQFTPVIPCVIKAKDTEMIIKVVNAIHVTVFKKILKLRMVHNIIQ